MFANKAERRKIVIKHRVFVPGKPYSLGLILRIRFKEEK
jgi:hypothetical protein